MKNRKTTSIVISLCCCLLYVSWTFAVQTKMQNPLSKELLFSGKATKNTLILGEPIRVQFEFTNLAESPLFVPKFGVEVGSLKIFIAGKDKEYKEYFSAGWGRQTGRVFTLEPKRSYQLNDVAILWNGKPNLSHLDETAAKQAMSGKITTEYVFPEPGIYFIKGLSYFSRSGEKDTFSPIECEPIQIEVKEPEGEDLKVWNQIKGRKEIARLMQNATLGTEKEELKEGLIEQVEQIILQHPNSVYTRYLKPNLDKFKADEVRRKQETERATIKPKN